jgi:ATP-dependent DNA helicase RecG
LRKGGGWEITVKNLLKHIEDGEGFTIEFKECRFELNNSVFETVCSFSNRYGGYIFLGVRDNGEIVGVNPNSINSMKKNFVNMLNNPEKINPQLFLNLEEVVVDDKIVLYVYVPVSSQVVFCSGRIFDRNHEADVDVTRSTMLAGNLFQLKSSQFTERKIFPYTKLEDLRLDLIPLVKRLALNHNSAHPWKDMSDMDFFRSSGLYEEDKSSGKTGFNLAGILLFGRDEVVRSCAVGLVTDCILRRENIDRYDDRLIVETNLIEGYDRIFEFIEKHTLDRFFLIDGHSVSVRSHIARELVSNILVHREYTSSYRSRVIIEQDRIVTDNWSRATFHGHIDPDSFIPRSKNPILAKFFVNIGRADELGSGVRNLYKYTRIYTGGAEPELIEGDVFKMTIPLVSQNKVQSDSNLKYNLKYTDYAENCTLTEKDILTFIRNNPKATQQDIAIGIHKSLNTVKNAMSKLQKLGYITRKGSKKKGCWIVNVDVSVFL